MPNQTNEECSTMQVYEVKGIAGLAKLGLAIAGLVGILFVLPSLFMMVLWNAVVFEGLNGPLIGFFQSVLLWLMFCVAFKLVFQPEIHLEFKKVTDPKDLDKNLKP